MVVDLLAVSALAHDVLHESSYEDAARRLVAGLTAMLGGRRCALVRRCGAFCCVEAAAPPETTPPPADDPGVLCQPVPPGPGEERLLLIDGMTGGDAALVAAAAYLLVQALHMVRARGDAAERGARERHLYRFAARLLAHSDPARLPRVIVEHMASGVGADTGALAVYRQREDALAILATCGYPSVLVDHVRIRPGEGIIGQVYLTARPLCAVVTPGAAGSSRQRRYRGDSYMAVPLIGPDGVLGVVSVTDPADDRRFTRRDLAVLREYAVPAALALSREALRDQTADLAHLATVDPVTGIFNRRHFDERLEAEIQRGRREGGPLALLMIDLDDFKAINDTRGHLYGDRVLREVGEILRRSVRSFDVCARYGGEEFVILMPGASAAIAVQVAERIRRYTEAHFADSWRFASSGRPTLSIGVSTLGPDMSPEALVSSADAALLWAKAAGKNTVKLDERSGAR